MAYWLAVPGAAEPHGYSRCWLPPTAAYSHSASLGRKPPSQMQKAYASYQFTQLIGRFSFAPAEGVHVSSDSQVKLGSIGPMLPSSVAFQPGSYIDPPLACIV